MDDMHIDRLSQPVDHSKLKRKIERERKREFEKTKSPFLGLGWSAPRNNEVNDARCSDYYKINLTILQTDRRSLRYKDTKKIIKFTKIMYPQEQHS